MRLLISEEDRKNILHMYNVLKEDESPSKNPVEMLSDTKNKIETLLSYYKKTDDGKFVDAQTGLETNLLPIGGFYKANIESILFGSKREKRSPEEITQIESIKDQILSGPFKEFFGEYDNIQIPTQKFDYYTSKKCENMKIKSPGCKTN